MEKHYSLESEKLRERDLLKSGKELHEKGLNDKAVILLNEVIEINPNNVEANFYLGNIFYMKGQIGKGIKAFKKVLELDPDFTDASIALSVLFNDIGQYEEAKGVFERAMKKVKGRSGHSGVDDPIINRKFSLKHFELGGMYLSYNRFDEALFEFNKAAQLDPGHLDCRVKISKIYAKKGYVLKAVDELKKLKNEHPNYLPAGVALGVLFYGTGNIIEAQNEWKRVLAKDPKNAEAVMYLNLSLSATETNLMSPAPEFSS